MADLTLLQETEVVVEAAKRLTARIEAVVKLRKGRIGGANRQELELIHGALADCANRVRFILVEGSDRWRGPKRRARWPTEDYGPAKVDPWGKL